MTKTSNCKQLKEGHGIDILRQIWMLENVSRSKGRYTSYLHFYMQCKHKDLTPKGIKIKSQMKNAEARQIIEKAEKALLNIRISEVVRKNNAIRKRETKLVEALQEPIPSGLKETLSELRRSSKSQKKKVRILKERKEKGKIDRTMADINT